MKRIGTCNGNAVIYVDQMVHIVGTEVTIYNVKDVTDAIKAANKNFKNFIQQ